MRDFTLKIFREYLLAIQRNDLPFLTFREVMDGRALPEKFCLIRHDVDRKPQNALNMAQLEHSLGIRSTYYFRTKPETFKSDIIKAVHELGHEVGYHYECLSDSKGDMDAAYADFAVQLERMRQIVPVSTISMHGRPLRPFDNRDMWAVPDRKALLKEKYDLLGEVYLDIDYTDIAYINDTGRNWYSDVSNRRDKVESEVPADHADGKALLDYLTSQPHRKMVFQIHPERWTDAPVEWQLQRWKDSMINAAKIVVSKVVKG